MCEYPVLMTNALVFAGLSIGLGLLLLLLSALPAWREQREWKRQQKIGPTSSEEEDVAIFRALKDTSISLVKADTSVGTVEMSSLLYSYVLKPDGSLYRLTDSGLGGYELVPMDRDEVPEFLTVEEHADEEATQEIETIENTDIALLDESPLFDELVAKLIMGGLVDAPVPHASAVFTDYATPPEIKEVRAKLATLGAL